MSRVYLTFGHRLSHSRCWCICFCFYLFSSFSEVFYQIVHSFGRVALVCIFNRLYILSFFSFDLFKFLCFSLCQTHLLGLSFHLSLKHSMSFITFFDLSNVFIDLSIEDIKSTVFLDLMSAVDISLNLLFLLNNLFFHLIVL